MKLGGYVQKIAVIGIILSGIASIASGGSCLIQHFVAGDLMDNGHLQECLALFTAGMAIISPGLHSLKIGVFGRPAVAVEPSEEPNRPA